MNKMNFQFNNKKVEINFIDENIITVQIFTYEDDFSNKGLQQEIVVDTKNDCIITGNLPNCLLNIYKQKESL